MLTNPLSLLIIDIFVYYTYNCYASISWLSNGVINLFLIREIILVRTRFVLNNSLQIVDDDIIGVVLIVNGGKIGGKFEG